MSEEAILAYPLETGWLRASWPKQPTRRDLMQMTKLLGFYVQNFEACWRAMEPKKAPVDFVRLHWYVQ